MWTATHAANAPCEDQSSSLVNVLLHPKNNDDHALIRLSLWSVIDGHGGEIMATYASQVLLPYITASISRCLDCDIVQQGECRVNNELREYAIDFQGLLESSGKSRYNANSIHYSTPKEDENRCDNDEESIESSKNKNPKGSRGTTTANHTDGPTGTHSTDEVARVTKAVSDSFCAVDEGWINSIDVATTRQKICRKNGVWNAGACALVVWTIQRLEWTRVPDEPCTVQDATSENETSQHCNIMDCEPELTETEDEGDIKSKPENVHAHSHQSEKQSELIGTTPGGCGCHVYSPQPAMLYTAHVGDCRAILLGNAPPDGRGGTVNGSSTVTTDEDSHDSEETELLSSSDSSSSDDDDLFGLDKTPPHLRYMTRPSRSIMRTTRLSRRNRPFIPLDYDCSDESDDEHEEPARKVSKKNAPPTSLSSLSENSTKHQSSILQLPASVHCLNLTTDHNPYNEAEASAVLRRCNNAPKAIFPGVSGGGLRRVAGSLAVTRALGDAYLKTPLLSFGSYKKHAPYITCLPQVNCRLLPPSTGDKGNASSVLVLATDGVWEQNSGEDVLGWIRNYSDKCSVAQAESEGNLGGGSNGDVGASSQEKKKRKLRTRRHAGPSKSAVSNASEFIVTRVLDKVGRSKNMSIREVLALSKGRARRYHDDITVSVVDLSKFVAS
jgi:pyruvate dehydrogenase phosphatase